MKYTVAIASLLATAALAKPLVHEQLHKRHFEYVEDVDTVYTTVTADSSSGGGWGSWGSWSGWGDNTPTSSAEPVAPTSAPLAPPSQAPPPVVTTTVAWSAPEASPVNTGGEGWGSSSPSPVQSSSGGDGWGSSAPASSPSSTGSSSGSGPGGVDIGKIVDQHNAHRANSSAPDIAWDSDLANIAAQIAASCVYAHDTSTGGGGYGQNIGAGAPPSDVPAMITNEMYNGEVNFYPTPYGDDNPDMSNFEKWGHYSQIVWKATTSVGCATQYCPNGLANAGSGVSPYFTVCNYKPAGNFGGQYSNVGQPLGQAPVTV